jgi:hypothetical protein
MSRRSFVLAVGILLLLTGVGATSLVLLVRYVPGRYVQAALPAGDERRKKSKEFEKEITALLSAMGSERIWGGSFTEEQINSYFDEKLVPSNTSELLLPRGISQPRVVIEPGRLRLAFRYGVGFWSTVISVDVRVWVAKGEPNVVALELESFRAGLLPMSAQSVLQHIEEVGRLRNIDVTWYRLPANGHPVALLRFQVDRPRATLQLRDVQLGHGEITIHGRSGEPSPARTQLTLPEPLRRPVEN